MWEGNRKLQVREGSYCKLFSLNQELDDNGYAVIDFLSESEVQSLLNLYKNKIVPEDLIERGLSFSINSLKVQNRQLIAQEVKKIITSKLDTLFCKHIIFLCSFISKKADALSSKMPLHQDPSFVDETSARSLGIWCPLIDVNEQNGCIQVVNKSHLLNSKKRPFTVFNGFGYNENILSLIQQHYLTSISMKAGQALVFDRRLFHGSPDNLTASERVAVICTLTPKNSPILFCYRESPTSDKIEVFEVDDGFYDRYIGGQKPEGVKSLGVFDYEVEPLTPEILIEKLGKGNSDLATLSVTIALVCWHSAITLLECLKSLAAQTYDQFDVIVLYPDAADESIQAVIAQAQSQFPGHKYLRSEADWSLGETYNYLVDLSAGEYVLLFSPDRIATPDLVEQFVTAAREANAVAVVCPQMVLAGGEEPEAINLVDGNLLKLLECEQGHDLTALFSKILLKEFPYCPERGLQGLNWQIFAAAIATDQVIAYYPYPLYAIRPDAESAISPANLAKERYYLRQYLFQIKPEQWNQRQINLLLNGFEQLVQSQP